MHIDKEFIMDPASNFDTSNNLNFIVIENCKSITYTQGMSLSVIIKDHLGSHIFKRAFATPDSCKDFLDEYVVSFSGINFGNREHPLAELFKNSTNGLNALEAGYVRVITEKTDVSMEPESKQDADKHNGFTDLLAHVQICRLAQIILTKYNQMKLQEEAKMTITNKIFKGIIETTTRIVFITRIDKPIVSSQIFNAGCECTLF
jgi:hypothetical protein